ncbi:MAG: polysaccharide deacetylase family protein [Verrucomicrobia bacterium]|nr:polysaccharide deacetylase family protein [Verrucomicrobiota bacterium]
MRRCTSVLFLFLSVLAGGALDSQDANSAASPTPSPTKPATYGQVQVDQPYVAMTFDDGPSAENTPRLLELLKQRNIKATFFLIGQNAAANPDLVRRILGEGHEVGNHSWSHPQLSKLSDDRVRVEITKTQDAIKQASGFTPTILRPPYGAITPRQRAWIETQFGLNIILWSVDPFDWKRPGASVITQRILSQVRPGAIILSHDIHKQTVDAMPATLDGLIAKGYKFATVSQLLAMNKPKPTSAEAAGDERSQSAKGRKSVSRSAPPEAEATPSGKNENDAGSIATPSPAGSRQ